MDNKDESIIRVLRRRAGLSSRTLSRMLGIPISTVHRRIKRMEQKGIITGYKALINFEKTAWSIGALALINLTEMIPGKGHIPKRDIVQSLSRLEKIEEIMEVQAANFDLALKARFVSLKKLGEFIESLRSIKGIEETSSAIITEEMVLSPKPHFSRE